jgi:hypothetical protein
MDLQEALKQREDFLEKNPHLKHVQKEIDEILDKCRDEDRLAVVNMLMMQNLIDLQRETLKLKEML